MFSFAENTTIINITSLQFSQIIFLSAFKMAVNCVTLKVVYAERDHYIKFPKNRTERKIENINYKHLKW